MLLFHWHRSPGGALRVGLIQALGLMRHIAAIALLTAARVASAGDAPISDAELSLSGVALGDTEQHVVSLLGSPSQKSETGEGTEFRYSDLEVLIGWLEQQAPGIERRAYKLTGTGPTACTPAGVCPGMPVERAVAAYGRPLVTEREAGSLLEYYSHQSTCWLQLATTDGTIRAISAVCQP